MYLIQQYCNKSVEYLVVVYLHNKKIIQIKELAKGNEENVSVMQGTIYLDCLRVRCNTIIMAHNHPNRYFAHPSTIDKKTAIDLHAFLGRLKVHLLTSIILTKHDTFWIGFDDELR